MALAMAAQRGVEVKLLIGVGEIWLQDMVARSFYPKLLASGVQVIEYRKTQLHAKVAVIDDDWSTVGSSNCDGLSLFLNQEANIVVRDHQFATACAPTSSTAWRTACWCTATTSPTKAGCGARVTASPTCSIK